MQRNGHEISVSITAFTNLLIEGKCHENIAPILLGGSVIALIKKTVGVRPIFIGYTWRRHVAKCANTFAMAELTEFLSPI